MQYVTIIFLMSPKHALQTEHIAKCQFVEKKDSGLDFLTIMTRRINAILRKK